MGHAGARLVTRESIDRL